MAPPKSTPEARGVRHGGSHSPDLVENPAVDAEIGAGGVFSQRGRSVASIIQGQTGVVLEPLKWNLIFWWGPATFVGLCVLGGLVPAMKAYRVPVAETIAPVS